MSFIPSFPSLWLEACLSIPIDMLVVGGRDRALARAAFAQTTSPIGPGAPFKGRHHAANGRKPC